MKKPYLEQEREARDHDAPFYDTFFPDYQHILEWRSLRNRLDQGSESRQAILDAGCGTGRFLARLLEMKGSVVGVDYSFQSLRLARQRISPHGAPRVVQADGRCLPFRDEAFDLVLCSEVITHLIDEDDAVAFLRELRRVLRARGRLVITAENYRLWLKMTWKKADADGLGHNYRLRTRAEYWDLLREAFFPREIVGIWGFLNLLHRPIPLGMTMPRVLWAPIMKADLWLEKTPLADWLAKLWLAEIRKEGPSVPS